MLNWRMVFAVWAVAVAAALAFGPRASVPTTLVGADALPRLPSAAPRDAEAQIAALRKASLWGVPASAPPLPGIAAAEPSLMPPEWRIVAVVAGSTDRFVVVQQANQPAMHELRTGQQLPDGSEIRRIEPAALYLIVRGNKRILRIDQQ